MPKRGYDKTGPMQGPKKRVRRTSTGAAASAAWRASPAFQKLNRRAVANKESGFVDLASASYNFNTSGGGPALIATIAQGASVNQRIGKKIMLKSIQIRGSAVAASTATTNDCALLIVYDRRPTGALPAITDILVSANSISFNNDANSGRFKILRRMDFTLAGNTTTMTESFTKNLDDYIKVNLPVEFQAAGTGAIGDISTGALYIVTVGNQAAGTAAASATLAFRTRFVDV